MKKLVAPLIAISFLSGCAAELAFYGAAAVTAVATAPVWLPIEYGVSQSKVKQPVEVVSRNGASLIPAFAGEPEAKLIVQTNAVICKGKRNLSTGGRGGPQNSELTCNKGLKGRLSFGGLTTKKAVVTVGPKSKPQHPDGSLAKVYQRCEGNFNEKKGVVAPFLLECEDNRYAVISPNSTIPDAKEFTVWLPPTL